MAVNPIITAITIDDFKSQFYRDFNFVDDWVAGTYNTGDKVFYLVNSKFYEAKADGITSTPNTANDWTLLQPNDLVSSKDITNAFNEALANFNSYITSDETSLKLMYLYLTAHYLTSDLNAVGGLGSNIVNSRSVGSVSESYSVPQWMLDKPMFSMFAKTSYGQKYLSLIAGYTVGYMATIQGGTNA